MALRSKWMPGGPLLPLEFARVGDHGELAVVLCEGTAPMPTYWARVDVATVEAARDVLRRREEISQDHPEWIGSVQAAVAPTHTPPHAAMIAGWMRQQALDAVVWTALPPRIARTEGRVPTVDEAVAYLDGLSGNKRLHARAYVEQVPADIATRYRQRVERRLGWLLRDAVEPTEQTLD